MQKQENSVSLASKLRNTTTNKDYKKTNNEDPLYSKAC